MARLSLCALIILLAGCAGRNKRAAIQQEAPAAESSETSESVEDLESLFADTDIFAEDPTLNETAINDSILGGDLGSTTDPTDSLFENSLLDDSQTTTTQTSNDPFADFFGSTVNSGTNDLLTSGVDTGTVADPTTTGVVDPTTGVLTGTTTPTSITGINSLTQPSSSLDLSSILNSMNSTPSTGNILDAGGGTSQILQMSSQLFP